MKRIAIVFLFLICMTGFLVASSINRLPLEKLSGLSDVVVVAEVVKVVSDGEFDNVTIEIQSVLKGSLKERMVTIRLHSRGGLKDFDPQLKADQKGVFFLQKTPNGYKKAYWGSFAIFEKPDFE